MSSEKSVNASRFRNPRLRRRRAFRDAGLPPYSTVLVLFSLLGDIPVPLVNSLSLSSTSHSQTPVRVVTSDLFSSHKPPLGRKHPECPERVTLAIERLKTGSDTKDCVDFATPRAEEDDAAREATLEAVLKVHDENYVFYLEALSEGGGGGLDADTYVAPLSFDIALLAQSAWLDATAHTIATGRPSFALCRPPGHHALRDRGMGFCLFNFCTVAAVHALDDPESGVERVAMLDWDVHHGNGVAALVREDPRIRYVSLHEAANFPSTPGSVSGAADDHGSFGNLLHLPMASESSWPQYEVLLREKALPWLQEFKPDLVIVSAGFDALDLDPLARQTLEARDFSTMSLLLRETLGDRIVLGLEGGYSLDPMGLPEAVAETIKALAIPLPQITGNRH